MGDDLNVDLSNVLSLNLNLGDILSLVDSHGLCVDGNGDRFSSDWSYGRRSLQDGPELCHSHPFSGGFGDIRQPQSRDMLASVDPLFFEFPQTCPSNLAALTAPSISCLFFILPCLPAAYFIVTIGLLSCFSITRVPTCATWAAVSQYNNFMMLNPNSLLIKY